MAAAFNWADWAIVAIVVVSMLISLKRGFVKEALSLVIWLAAVFLSLMFNLQMQQFLQEWITTPSVRQVVAFVLLFVAVLLAGGIMSWFVTELVKLTGLTGTDRMLGMVFGFVRGVLLALVILMVLPLVVSIAHDDWYQQSQLIPHLMLLEGWVRDVASQFLKLFSGNLGGAVLPTAGS